MSVLEEKYDRLSPAAQNAVRDFIDFLLSREEDQYREDEEESSFASLEPESETVKSESVPDQGKTGSGIILAEEKALEERDDIIDFADINTRFSQTEKKKDPIAPVRQKKMFDWL